MENTDIYTPEGLPVVSEEAVTRYGRNLRSSYADHNLIECCEYVCRLFDNMAENNGVLEKILRENSIQAEVMRTKPSDAFMDGALLVYMLLRTQSEMNRDRM